MIHLADDQQKNSREQIEARGSSLHMSLGCGGPRNVGQKRCVFTLGGQSHVFFFAVSPQLFLFFLGWGWVKEQSWTLHDFCQVELCIFSVSWWVVLGVGMWKACYLYTYAVHMYILYYTFNYFDCFPLNWSPILQGGGNSLNLWRASLDVSLVGVGTVSRGPSRAVWVGRFPTRIE